MPGSELDGEPVMAEEWPGRVLSQGRREWRGPWPIDTPGTRLTGMATRLGPGVLSSFIHPWTQLPGPGKGSPDPGLKRKLAKEGAWGRPPTQRHL